MFDEPAATGPAGRCHPGSADAPGIDQGHLRADPDGSWHGAAKRAEIPRGRSCLGRQAVVEGGSPAVCNALGIPPEWAARCEDAASTPDTTKPTMPWLSGSTGFWLPAALPKFAEKVTQLGSYGGGNHFGECEVVQIADNPRARRSGRRSSDFATITWHSFPTAGLGAWATTWPRASFARLQQKFETWGIPLPGGDRELVYAPLGTPEADDYLDDMALGGNFATVNHLLINALVLEAFQEVFPGAAGRLVYFISHNIARRKSWTTGWLGSIARARPGRFPAAITP